MNDRENQDMILAHFIENSIVLRESFSDPVLSKLGDDLAEFRMVRENIHYFEDPSNDPCSIYSESRAM